jgi:hypothetical protein
LSLRKTSEGTSPLCSASSTRRCPSKKRRRCPVEEEVEVEGVEVEEEVEEVVSEGVKE